MEAEVFFPKVVATSCAPEMNRILMSMVTCPTLQSFRSPRSCA